MQGFISFEGFDLMSVLKINGQLEEWFIYIKNGSILLSSLIIGFSSTISYADVKTQRIKDIKTYTLVNGDGIEIFLCN